MSENRKTAVEKMDELGLKGIPFLFIIDFDFKAPIVLGLDETQNYDVLFNIDGMGNDENIKAGNFEDIEFDKKPINFQIYEKAFDSVLKNIKHGNSYLLNLTFPTKIKTNLTLKEIFHLSKAKYKLLFKNDFVCFSPEIFVKIENGTISSYPMKGTIDADSPDALNQILEDKKEEAEHNTIVDLIRNDLSIVAQNVRVTKFRYPDYIKTNNKNLIQISSEIKGELLHEFQNKFGSILEKLLPAGSVTGAPKQKTVEIIKSAENYERGYYTGVFGIFDGKKLESGVMIRFIENINEELYFKSGGGITFMSDCQSEYRELIDKVYLPF